MGDACSKDTTVSTGQLPDLRSSTKARVSEDPTLVLPDFSDLKSLINRKAGEMDIDITRSQRGTSGNSDLSLILPACKSYSSTLIIKYFLVYSFYIAKYSDKNGDKRKYQKLFYDVLDEASKQKEEKEVVAKLKADIQKQGNDIKQCVKLIDYIFQHGFILEYLNKALLFSKDPKNLAYFIFPIHALHNGIKATYHKSSYTKRTDPIFIVAVLESTEANILKQLQGHDNYFFFSAFIRGFTDENCARQQFKSIRKSNKSKTFLFTVNFPYKYASLNTAENNGFYIFPNADNEIKKKGDVLFNIMSSFKVSSKTENFEYDLDYGSLAQRVFKKINDRDQGKEPVLIKIYELCRGISKYYLKSQSCLFRIMKGSSQSLGVSNLVLSGTKASNSGNLNAVNDIEKENIINTHIDLGEYDQALKKAGEKDTLLFKAKKIQILFKKGKEAEAKQEIAKVADSQKNGNIEARVVIDQVSARLEMSNKQYDKAQMRLKQLYKAMMKAYPNDFEFMGREVVAALMECEKKGGGKAELEQSQGEAVKLYTTIGEDSLHLSSVSMMK